MTKEQLIKFIDKNIPDGDLVNIKVYIGNTRYFLDICGIDDDCNAGVWNLCAMPISSEYFDSMIENSIDFEKIGYSMENKQWFDITKNN